jgi:hypothetical protein
MTALQKTPVLKRYEPIPSRLARGLYGINGGVSTPQRLPLVLTILTLVSSACGAGGQYNHARTYKPLGDEKGHYKAVDQHVSLEEVKRDPNGFKDNELGWFGVVTDVGEGSDGKSRLKFSLRAHQERHLCTGPNDDTCRLTVSEKDLGSFVADVDIRPEDRSGFDRLWVGSLVRVYGHPTGQYDNDGAPLIDVEYYRHFPRGTFVTTAARMGMRQ